MIRIRAVLLLCGVLIASPAFGASPDPKELEIPPEDVSKARELIRRLGNESVSSAGRSASRARQNGPRPPKRR